MNKEQLKQFISRIENLNNSLEDTKTDIKEVYAEAKFNGYDVKAIRKIIKMRKDLEKAKEENTIVLTYCEALQLEMF